MTILSVGFSLTHLSSSSSSWCRGCREGQVGSTVLLYLIFLNNCWHKMNLLFCLWPGSHVVITFALGGNLLQSESGQCWWYRPYPDTQQTTKQHTVWMILCTNVPEGQTELWPCTEERDVTGSKTPVITWSSGPLWLQQAMHVWNQLLYDLYTSD